MAGPRGRREKRSRGKTDSSSYVNWDPKTKLGRMVREKQITTMIDALNSGLPLREPEIVDILVPDINDEVVDVNMVQRMTDSGRRVKFVISVAVGNNNGYIGFGQAKGKEVGSSIRNAIDNAKLNIIAIRRGCGSWECGCGKPHTVPFAVKGKSGSVEVILKPAPRGIGLATGNVAKKILTLAGIKDCWTFTDGKTKTTVNYAKAVFNALEQNAEKRVMPGEIKKIGIILGSISPNLSEKQVNQNFSESKTESAEIKPEVQNETKEAS